MTVARLQVAQHVRGAIPAAPGLPRVVPIDAAEPASSPLPGALARGSPEEGARDLALMEALLTSCQAGGAAVQVQKV